MAATTQFVQKPPVSSSVLGVIMAVIVEIMFFGGLISSYIYSSAGQLNWPPSDQPRLPFWLTFGNMLVLILSAVTLYLYILDLKKEDRSTRYLKMTLFLGTVFFLVQGYEWVRILVFGVESGRSLFTSFFYAIIGLHGLHVLAGLIILIYVYQKIVKSNDFYIKHNYAVTAAVFWFFVVALWPVLYYLVYWIS